MINERSGKTYVLLNSGLLSERIIFSKKWVCLGPHATSSHPASCHMTNLNTHDPSLFYNYSQHLDHKLFRFVYNHLLFKIHRHPGLLPYHIIQIFFMAISFCTCCHKFNSKLLPNFVCFLLLYISTGVFKYLIHFMYDFVSYMITVFSISPAAYCWRHTI